MEIDVIARHRSADRLTQRHRGPGIDAEHQRAARREADIDIGSGDKADIARTGIERRVKVELFGNEHHRTIGHKGDVGRTGPHRIAERARKIERVGPVPEQISAFVEIEDILIRDVDRRGEERCAADGGTVTEHDPVLVDQPQIHIGRVDRSADHRHVAADHPVEQRRLHQGGIGGDIDRGALRNVESVPVGDHHLRQHGHVGGVGVGIDDRQPPAIAAAIDRIDQIA